MKILIADILPVSTLNVLKLEGWTVDARPKLSLEELKTALADTDALIVRSSTKVTAELIASAPRLRVIARAGSGVDNIDLNTATERGILVVNAPGVNSVSVAEHTLALMLALSRSIPLADAQMKDGRWEKKSLQGSELRSKTLGILGLGRIGREVARRAMAFEMKIVAHDPFIAKNVADDMGIELMPIETLCKCADYISLHLPSTTETRSLLNKELLSRCKSNVRIINTARGDLIDYKALSEGIRSGKIAGAGLDVFQVEPPIDTELTKLPQVIATPHIAASTVEAQEMVGIETAIVVKDFLSSGIVRNAVNFPSVAPEDFRRLKPYITLAENLGSLLSQLTKERIKSIGIRYYGELAGANQEMLIGAVLVGLFRTVLSSTVTLVNARSIAEQRGLEIIESHSSRPRNFTGLISVKLYTNQGERWAEGAVFEPNEPRLVLLDGVEVEAPLDGSLIVIQNTDQPGVIGEVGTILGRHKINIATFALGRGDNGAVGVVKIESEKDIKQTSSSSLPNSLLKEIGNIPAVLSVGLVKL